MQYAILSDIHSNLDALETVLAHAGDLPLLCLGDLVGYGAQPNEVVELIRDRAQHTIMGNHDLACVDGTGIEYFNPRAAASARWTNAQLSKTNLAWLKNLPYTVHEHTFTLVHGSPEEPKKFHYILDRADARLAFAANSDPLTFVGHSHLPGTFEKRSDGISVKPIQGERIIDLRFGLERGVRYIVNVGSTGQPRDEDPRASYVVYDDIERTVRWHRVAYDVASAQAKIRKTSLPASLADRLATGN